MNGFRRHRTLVLLAAVAFLAAFAGGLITHSTADANEDPEPNCNSGSCNCLKFCPATGTDLCYGHWTAPPHSVCAAVCIPNPDQLCDIP